MKQEAIFSQRAIFNLLSDISETKALLSGIINNMMEFYLLLDSEQNISATNLYTLKLLGYNKYDIIGYSYDFIFKEGREKVRRAIDALAKQETSGDFEIIAKTKEGKDIPLLVSLSKVINKYNNVENIILIGKDISDQKCAEEALRRFNEELELKVEERTKELLKEKNFSENIVATIPDSLLVLDKDLRIKSANCSFYESFQIESEKVIGISISDILGDTEGKLSSELTKLFGTEDIQKNFELPYRSEKLGERIFNITARRMLIEEEEEELLVIKDITGRKRLQEKEKEVEAARAATEVIESMPDALIVLDLNGVILSINPALTEMLGYEPEERVGKRFDELGESLKAEDIEKFMELLGELIETGHVEPVETVLHAKDGREIPMSVTYSLSKDAEGKPKNIIVVLRDITELKRAEEERIKAETEAEAARATTEIIKAMPDPLVVLNLEGEAVSVNPAHLKMFGFKSPDEAMGKSFGESPEAFVNPEEDIPKVLELFKDVIEKGHTDRPVELNLRMPGGSTEEFVVSASAAVIKDAEGNPTNVVTVLKDITEIKQAEEELREVSILQERAAIIEAVPDSLVVLNLDGELISVNPAHLKMFGHKSADEILGTGFDGIKERFPDPEKDIPKFLGLFKEVIEKGSTEEPVEIRLRRVDGKEFFAAASASLLRDTEGNPKNVVATLRDITEFKRLQEEEKEAAASKAAREIMESTQDVVYMLDLDGNVVMWNKAMVEITGYSAEELEGKPVAEFIAEEDREMGAEGLKEAFERGYATRETQLLTREGEEIPYSWSASILKDEEGNIRGIVGIGKDITERKRAEEALRRFSEELELKVDERTKELRGEKNFSENIVATVPDSLLVLDADLRIKSANCTFYEKFRTEPEKVIGTRITDILQDGDGGKLSSELTRLFGTEDMLENFELHYQSEKLGERIFDIRARRMLVAEEEEEEELVVLEDITERKRAEYQIKASLKEKEVLLREIHHRVKNNLQIISSLLNMQARKATDKNVIVSLLDSRNRIQTMALIHSQLYQNEDLAQVEMGNTISKLVDDLLQIYITEENKISSVVTAEGVILPISQAVPLGLIINELVTNALKYAFQDTKKGSIEISMREIAGDFIELTVKDDGVGIPEDFQISKTHTLGLNLVRNLTEIQLKGELTLNRDEETKFYIKYNKSILNDGNDE